MFDASMQLTGNFPATGQSLTLTGIDLGIDLSAFSVNHTQGFLRISWEALPNHVDPSKTITVTLVDSGDGGATFQAGGTGTAAALPQVQVEIPGQVGGVAAGHSDMMMPRGLRGPVGVTVAVPAGVGDCSGAFIKAAWYVE